MIFRKERSVTRDDEKKILMTFIRLEGRERDIDNYRHQSIYKRCLMIRRRPKGAHTAHNISNTC